jgi:hypothetical protein
VRHNINLSDRLRDDYWIRKPNLLGLLEIQSLFDHDEEGVFFVGDFVVAGEEFGEGVQGLTALGFGFEMGDAGEDGAAD